MVRGRDAQQFVRYLAVGGLCWLAELAVFWLMVEAGIGAPAAAALSFVLANVLNYVLSVGMVFARRDITRRNEIGRFVLVVVAGAALNAAVVWVLTAAGTGPFPAKVAALAPTLAWNYLARRWWVFAPALPGDR